MLNIFCIFIYVISWFCDFIIFVHRESKKQAIVEEATRRLKVLIDTNFKAIATELQDHDHYLYHRAYTNGMQEFVEAVVFCQFLKTDGIGTWDNINDTFQYNEDDTKFDLLFSQYDFILGIADFTGELMRRCINSLGIGNIDDCFKLCNFVKHVNTGFLGKSHIFILSVQKNCLR